MTPVVSIDQPKYVKASVIARLYGISEVTVMRWARKGTIPAKRFANGGRAGLWRFDLAAVDAALDRNGREAQTKVG